MAIWYFFLRSKAHEQNPASVPWLSVLCFEASFRRRHHLQPQKGEARRLACSMWNARRAPGPDSLWGGDSSSALTQTCVAELKELAIGLRSGVYGNVHELHISIHVNIHIFHVFMKMKGKMSQWHLVSIWLQWIWPSKSGKRLGNSDTVALIPFMICSFGWQCSLHWFVKPIKQ